MADLDEMEAQLDAIEDKIDSILEHLGIEIPEDEDESEDED